MTRISMNALVVFGYIRSFGATSQSFQEGLQRPEHQDDESAETEASETAREVDITIPEGSQPGDVLSIEVNGKMLEVSGTPEFHETLSLGQHARLQMPFLLGSSFHFCPKRHPESPKLLARPSNPGHRSRGCDCWFCDCDRAARDTARVPTGRGWQISGLVGVALSFLQLP